MKKRKKTPDDQSYSHFLDRKTQKNLFWYIFQTLKTDYLQFLHYILEKWTDSIFSLLQIWFWNFSTFKAVLSFEELTTVKRNLLTDSNVEVDYELIRETWHPVYRRHFLRKALRRCHDCRRGYFMYSKGIESDVSRNMKVFQCYLEKVAKGPFLGIVVLFVFQFRYTVLQFNAHATLKILL